jgi:multiple antibiotic resistance protein
MLTTFITVFIALITIVDPPGAVPVFLAMTPHDTPQERNRIALHTSIYYALILLSFFLAGSYILKFFGISLDAMRIAGGLIILQSGFDLLQNKFALNRSIDKKVKKEALQKSDISFAPMAMPLLAGPGSISYLITAYIEHPGWNYRLLVIGVILASALVTYFTLRLAPKLQRLLGAAGLNALSRIMGFLVMAIAVQYIVGGIVSLVRSIQGIH